jgi:hypothetical protein
MLLVQGQGGCLLPGVGVMQPRRGDDGRLLDLVGVNSDGEPRRARALQLPAARR